ncbi:MAG: hypothetical protein K2L21_01250 [Muribaculaceae bacterium]|nr:hypothetical protein [Muribaculaceae bacterium]
MIKRLYWTASLVLIAAVSLGACSSESTDEPRADEADKHEVPEKGISYDERFPFQLWVDESGAAHINADLSSGFPDRETVVKSISGKGWKLMKNYINRKYTASESGFVYRFEETDFLGDWVGGDLDLKLYFNKAGQYINYYRWLPGLVGIEDPNEYFCAENGTYTYDATTGVLDCRILGSYKLVDVDDDNMWFVHAYDDGAFDIVHLKSVSSATLKEWNEKYVDADKAKDLLNN